MATVEQGALGEIQAVDRVVAEVAAVPATLEEALERAQSDAQQLDLRKNESGAERGKRTDRYLSYPKLLAQVRPVLLASSLTWTTFPTTVEENGLLKPALRYRLTFVPTREFQEDTMLLALKENTSQAQGSGITYARRYALQAVLDLAPDGDDDGHAATVAAPRPAPVDPESPMSEESVNAMVEALAERGWTIEQVYEHLRLTGVPTIAHGRAVKRLLDDVNAEVPA